MEALMQTLHQIFDLQEFTFFYQFVTAGTSAICFYKSYGKNKVFFLKSYLITVKVTMFMCGPQSHKIRETKIKRLKI